MILWETVRLAQREIRLNVLRSSLTVLGIVIGVAAVITMVTLGAGATAQVTNDIAKLGSNLLLIRPGQGFRGPGGTRNEAVPFEIHDVEAVAGEIDGLEAVAPVDNAGAQVVYGNINIPTSIIGSTDRYLDVRDWSLAGGRRFTSGEMRSGKAVCIIGNTVRENLFEGRDPLGETIRIQRISFEVIGTLVSKGASAFGSDQDDYILVPLRTFQRRISGNTDVSRIYVSALDNVSTDAVKRNIEDLMRMRRKVGPGEEDSFYVRDMKEIVSALTGTTKVLTMLLGAVAAVSLLVGGIGIMNIMLVSVTERTKEIGIRLAVGAQERDVLMQFLVEAVVLASFGGIVGILLGLAGAAGGAQLLEVPFVVDYWIIILAFVFSGGIGVGFGYFPARKAARLDPIDALRHE